MLHPNQWRIYAEHYRLDLEEDLDKQREFAEYVMAFYNVDGVRSVQRAREAQRRNADRNLGDIFAKQVEQLLGRSLNYDEMDSARKKVGADKATYIPEPGELDDEDLAPKEMDTMKVKTPAPPPVPEIDFHKRFRAMHEHDKGK